MFQSILKYYLEISAFLILINLDLLTAKFAFLKKNYTNF